MEIDMVLWNISMDDRGLKAATRMAAPESAATEGGSVGGNVPASEPPATTIKQLQEAVLSNLKNRRGILDGRDLYRVYKESDQAALKIAIRELEKNNLVSVKGDLEAPLGVFQSVLVER